MTRLLRMRLFAVVLTGSLSGVCRSVSAQPCTPEWSDRFASRLPGQIRVLLAADVGFGPAVYAGGAFLEFEMLNAGVVRWDGVGWSSLGAGVAADVKALATFDDGAGPAVYAAGAFYSASSHLVEGVAKWDGTAWNLLGGELSHSPSSLVAFDDGSGPTVYVGGVFVSAGGAPANHIARWDGSAWRALGEGTDGPVTAMAVFDDGGGPALFVAGHFATAGGIAVNHVAKWDGTTWSPLAGGLGGDEWTECRSLAVFDDGTGAALYAGGAFSSAGGVSVHGIAKWDGVEWTALPEEIGGEYPSVWFLTTCHDGSAPALYAGGFFAVAGGAYAPRIAKWNGSFWSPVGHELDGVPTALVAFDRDGAGPRRPDLLAAGGFVSYDDVLLDGLGRWDGNAWQPLGLGLSESLYCSTTFDDSDGPSLYVGGMLPCGVAKLGGGHWECLADGMYGGEIYALASFDSGDGPELYAGGYFTVEPNGSNLARWDGVQWSWVGGQQFDAPVRAMIEFDDGSGRALYIGGDFESGPQATHLIKWDGMSFSDVGDGSAGTVFDLVAFDDGSGPALYAAGFFWIDGNPVGQPIARWDGSSWSAVGSGLNQGVYTLAVFDDGNGPALYAGGVFTMAGDTAVNRVARWNGAVWTPLGSGLTGGDYMSARAMEVFDDGSGPALYVGGLFPMAGGVPVNNLARWDGTSWSSVSGGTDSIVFSLTACDDDGGGPEPPALYAGGLFCTTGGVPSPNIARWGCPPIARAPGDLNCDGAVSVEDISHFVQALVDPAGYDADHDGSPYARCDHTLADINQDGFADGLDVQAFVEALLGG